MKDFECKIETEKANFYEKTAIGGQFFVGSVLIPNCDICQRTVDNLKETLLSLFKISYERGKNEFFFKGEISCDININVLTIKNSQNGSICRVFFPWSLGELMQKYSYGFKKAFLETYKLGYERGKRKESF